VVNSFESETIWPTDGQADIPTYRLTLAKQDAPSPSKGAFNENKSFLLEYDLSNNSLKIHFSHNSFKDKYGRCFVFVLVLYKLVVLFN